MPFQQIWKKPFLVIASCYFMSLLITKRYVHVCSKGPVSLYVRIERHALGHLKEEQYLLVLVWFQLEFTLFTLEVKD